MKKFFQIICALSIFGTVVPSVSFAVLPSGGYADTEVSNVSTFSVASLDFSLNGGVDFSPQIAPAQNALRTIDINNDGSSDFDYSIKSDNVSGDLCNYLNLSATLGAYNYTGPISGFNYSVGQFGVARGNWQFEMILTDDDLSLQNKICNFNFVVDGTQIGGAGFSDQETISNTVTSGYWSVVLNEFLPNPIGSDSVPMLGGEWIELYNNRAESVDLAGWVIYDSSDSHDIPITASNTNTGGTVIEPRGFLVVYRNGDAGFALNNTGGDAVRLYDKSIGSGGVLIDSYSYTIDAQEGKSFARFSDGTGAWVDPIPTPGSPNTLECAQQSFGFALSEPDEQDNYSPEIIPQEQPQEETASEEVSPEEPAIEEEPVVEPEALAEERAVEEQPPEQEEIAPEEAPQENLDSGVVESAPQTENTIVNTATE